LTTDDYDLFVFSGNTRFEAFKLIHQLRAELEPVIYDCDHDLLRIPSDNPTYNRLLQEPGGAWFPLQAMRLSSLVTVPGLELKKLYEPLNHEIHVLPNCISLEDWANIPQLGWGDKIALGWAGSPTHRNSLLLLKDALIKIVVKYPEVHLVFMGQRPPFEIPKGRATFISWGDYSTYQTVVKSFDIALAPLSDVPFNWSKSDLRLKEYACADLPIVASDIGEYKAADSFGFIFKNSDELFDTLEELVRSPGLRKRKGVMAKEWVKLCDIKNHIDKWLGVYELAIDKARAKWAS